MVCLFLFCIAPAIHSQDFQFSATTREAYYKVLNLQFADVRRSLQNPQTPQEHYVLSFSEALELIVTEDHQLLGGYEAASEKRTDRKSAKKSADELLLQSEIHLQWAFVYLKFGQELDAAFRLRHAYLIAEDIRMQYPGYKAVYKISGLLNVLIGSVPDKYSWILGLLNMQGSVDTGLRQLHELSDMDHDLAFEATLWYAFIHGFILQAPEKAIEEMRNIGDENPLAAFLLANFHMKNASSERALAYLQRLESATRGTRIPYASYLKGEVYLHKGDYPRAIEAYTFFLRNYRGQNYVKDAHYKIGLCYWLDEKQEEAIIAFAEAENAGKESAEADKHAARNLASSEMPSIPLTRVRFFTDGGYYREATEVLDRTDANNFSERRHQVEWYYRKARLLHKQNRPEEAKPYYQKTIELAEMNEWYFAPNSCLQLGYLAREKGDTNEARTYFEKALTYRRHEYKNSIDSKARSALAQLKERR